MGGDIALKRALRRPSVPFLIALTAGLLSLGMSLWQLSVPEFLSYYDSGVYMAATIHLVSGVMPYRDFVFVQPPGLLLILSPVGVISRVFGSHDGLIVGRILGALVTGLNAGLLAWLVRYRGRFAMAVAGYGLALFPVASYVSSSVKLEPYCICLTLVAVVIAFPNPERAIRLSTRALVAIGVLFGLAALVKLWAIFPFVALVVALLPRCRRRVLTFIYVAGATFVVGCLPFLVAAPRSFVSEVFVEQLARKSDFGVNVLTRLVDISGFYGTSLAPSHVEVLVAFIAFAGLVFFGCLQPITLTGLDVFLVAATITTLLGLLSAPVFYLYYGYFSAPFLLGLFAISLSRLRQPARALINRLNLSRDVRRLTSRVSLATAGLLIFALTLYVTTFYTNYAWAWGLNSPNLTAVSNRIPAGSCVVYDYVIYGIFSNRARPSNSRCPDVVDPNGMWMGWGYQVGAVPRGLVAQWKNDFRQAHYVVLNAPHTSYVGWDQNLTVWFANHYHMVFGRNGVYIYANDANH